MPAPVFAPHDGYECMCAMSRLLIFEGFSNQATGDTHTPPDNTSHYCNTQTTVTGRIVIETPPPPLKYSAKRKRRQRKQL